MRIRKIAAIILALVVAASFPMSAFASIGGYASSPSNTAPATTAHVTAATTEAIKQAATTGSAAVKLQNVATLHSSVVKDVFTQAAKAGVKDTVIHMDVKEGNTVLSRVYVDEATAAKLTGTVDFSVSTKGAAVDSTVKKFEKFFDNNITAVSLGHKGAFGADVKMAVKVDLSKHDTSNLVFYSYDKETGKYAKLNVEHKIGSNGYLHFSTPVGGHIIITDKPLTRK